MTKELNKEIKQYLKRISMLLPIRGKAERLFLSHLKTSVTEYANDNPQCTIKDIIEKFEEPEAVVFNYLSALEQEELYKKLSIRKFIRRAIAIVLLLLTIYTVFRMVLLFDLYLEGKNSIIRIEETVIE